MKYTYLFLIAFSLISCSLLDTEDIEKKESPLVKVDENFLYPSNLKGIGRGLSPQDSTRNAEKFIEHWIRNELLLNEAKKDSSINTAEIEERLEQLRRDLYIYEYEKNLIQIQDDSIITDAEIQAFFKANPSNFELKQNIFKGYFIKIDKKSPSFAKIKKQLQSGKPDDLVKLNQSVTEEADTYHIDTLIWHNFDDVSRNTPFDKVVNQKNYLTTTNFEIRYSNEFAYLIKIIEYKLASEIAPIEFHEDMIRNTLIHKRNRQLIQENEENLYHKAKKDDRFEIYF